MDLGHGDDRQATKTIWLQKTHAMSMINTWVEKGRSETPGPSQKAAQLDGSGLKVAGTPLQEATKATTLATSKTAGAEAKDEQQASAESSKAAKATGATDAEPAKHGAQAASAWAEANHKPRQQVAQLSAGAVEAAGGSGPAGAQAAGAVETPMWQSRERRQCKACQRRRRHSWLAAC